MTFTRLSATLRLKVTPEVAFAAAYLESRGLRFCIHFGTDNAVSLAARLMTSNRLEFVGERHG